MQTGASELTSLPRTDDGLHLSESASVFQRIRASIKALRVLVKAPDDPIAAAMLNAAMDGDVFRNHGRALALTDSGRALLAERPSLQKKHLDLAALAQLPEGIVGRALAQYYVDNKILPFESPYEIRNDTDFLISWYRETHDLHHVLTGYATNAIGEMELQAFALGNLGFRHSKMILTTAVLFRPHNLPPIWKYWRRVTAAYRRGKAAKNLFSLRYEQLLEEEMTKVRASLGLLST